MAGRTPGCRQFLLFHYQQCALADGFPAAASRNLGETDLLMSFFLIGTRSHTHTHTHTRLESKHPKGRAALRGQLLNAGPRGANCVGLAVLKPNAGWKYLSGRSRGPSEVLPTFGYQPLKARTVVSLRYRACHNPRVTGM